MARELGRILNNRIGLSTIVDEANFATVFANGYHVGELLSKFGLQPDFAFLVNQPDDETKIRNYSRVVPALQDLGVQIKFEEIQRLSKAFPGSAEMFVYRLLKALKVLPMRDPKWTVHNATKFHRKGSWADFAAMANIDYESFRMLDSKYQLPGEEQCRDIELRLRKFLAGSEPVDLTLVKLRAEANERKALQSDWQHVVQQELDRSDETRDEEKQGNQRDGNPADTPAAPRVAEIAAAIPPVVPVLQSRSVTVSQTTAPERIPNAEGEIKLPEQISLTTLSYINLENTLMNTEVDFDKTAYLASVHVKATEYRQKKADAAMNQQMAWMEKFVEKKKERAETLLMERIKQINDRAEDTRRKGRDALIARRKEFDGLGVKLVQSRKENIARQHDYVRLMVNSGFWDMLADHLFTEEALKEWCSKSDLPYDPQLYQILSRNYNSCKDLILDCYDELYFGAYEKVATDEGEDFIVMNVTDKEASSFVPSPTIQEEPEPVTKAPTIIPKYEHDEDNPYRITDPQPALTWNDPECEEYRDTIHRIQYSDLGWMQRFVDADALEKRNLGHIVSCIINGPDWQTPTARKSRYHPKYVSLCITGRRGSQLKKAILAKLAATYNLEIINIGDIVQEAVEMTLGLQPQVAEVKDKVSSRRKSKTMTATKRTSLAKMSRGKSRSLASPVSSLASASSRLSPKGDLGARILRSLMDDGSVDAGTIVELIDVAIDSRVLNMKAKTPDQLMEMINPPPPPPPPSKKGAPASEAASNAGAPKKGDAAAPHAPQKKGADGKTHRSDSKSKIHEPQPEKPAEPPILVPQPFGWILTDSPITLDVMTMIEQKLGAFSARRPREEPRWISSSFAPDEFGPKTRPLPKSFFGAILNIDCPNETVWLPRPPERPVTPPPEKVEEEERTSPLEPSRPRKYKANSPLSQALEEMDLQELATIFSAADIKRQLAKFMSTLDMPDNEVNWSALKGFYTAFQPSAIKSFDKWEEPPVSYAAMCNVIQGAFDACCTTCAHGISPSAQVSMDNVLRDVCGYVWRHRTKVRHQLVQRMVGLRIAKSVSHYLFKQDVVLLRQVYYRCLAKLREIVRSSPEIDLKHIGIALYRETKFPFESRIARPDRVVSAELRARERQDLIKQARRQLSSNLAYPATNNMRTERRKVPGSTEKIAKNASSWHKWMLAKSKPFKNDVLTWHRKNELVLKVVELSPEKKTITVMDFPFVGSQTCPEGVEQWSEIESGHVENVVGAMSLLRTADYRLTRHTEAVKVVFTKCLRTPNLSMQKVMARFTAEHKSMVQARPEVHATLHWSITLNRIRLELSAVNDRRRTGLMECLRFLLKNNGYSQRLLEYRNAFLEMVRLEVQTFRATLRFLWTAFCGAVKLRNNDFLALPRFSCPSYEIDENALDTAAAYMERYDIEAYQDFGQTMVSGDYTSEHQSFLEIITDDRSFWENILELTQFLIRKCGRVYMRKIKTSGVSNQDEASGYVHDSILDDLLKEQPAVRESAAERIDAQLSEHSTRTFTTLPSSVTDSAPVISYKLGQPLSETLKDDRMTPWMETFEKFDLPDFLATVCHDVRRRQKVKSEFTKHEDKLKDAEQLEKVLHADELTHNEGEDEKDRQLVRDRRRLCKLSTILRQTIKQESNLCMLKICSIAVACTRKSNAVRTAAGETFRLLDQMLHETHRSAQETVEQFCQDTREQFTTYDAMAHLNREKLGPDRMFCRDDGDKCF